MERFVKFACYCRGTITRSDNAPPPPASPQVGPTADPSSSALNAATEASRQQRSQETEHGDGRTGGDGTRPLWNFLQRVLSVENLFKSVQVFLTGNIVFMIFLMLHLRGLSMSSSILLLLTIWYNMILIVQIVTNHHTMDLEVEMLFSKLEQLKQMAKKMLHNMGQLRDEQPGLFCIAACSVSVIIWLLDYVMSGMLLKYIFFMLILLISAVMIYLTVRRLPMRSPPSNRRESDSEIEEFLPAATETNIQILTKAGDVGEYSTTPTSALAEVPKEHEEQGECKEFLNDNDLAGHKMPSHEDGSSDGLELSDLELSEKSSTSSCSGQSDSEFEIIDQQEIGKLCTSQNTT